MIKLKSVKTKLGNEIELISTIQPFNSSTIQQVLVVGVVHGDEPQGKFLIDEYLKKYIDNPSLELEIPVLPQGEDKKFLYNHKLRNLSKNLRNNSTKQEIKLWQHLKQKQLGVKFRRQQPMGNYIVDFVCFEKKLIIELDGGQHNNNENQKKDELRDSFFKNIGYKVIRIWNTDIDKNISGVINFIQTKLTECPLVNEKSLISTREEICVPHMRGDQNLRFRGGTNLLFIPCLNPDGMALGTRTNANGVDLNRNFPTKNWGQNEGDNATCDDKNSAYYGGISGGSEIETRFLIDTIDEFEPNLIITLHAPYKVVNYDGPAKDVAEKISQIIKYPVEESIGYPTPGSFGTYAGIERQIPTITLELDEICPVEDLINPVHQIFDLF